MRKQVLSVEQMQHLQELGMDTSNASMLHCRMYIDDDDHEYVLVEKRHHNGGNEIVLEEIRNSVIYCRRVVPVYTLQDVLDLLPKQIGTEYIYDLCIFPESISYTQFIGGEMNDTMYEIPINGNLLDSAYEMLCWCIKEGHITKN